VDYLWHNTRHGLPADQTLFFPLQQVLPDSYHAGGKIIPLVFPPFSSFSNHVEKVVSTETHNGPAPKLGRQGHAHCYSVVEQHDHHAVY
jgi:hypothetical protein